MEEKTRDTDVCPALRLSYLVSHLVAFLKNIVWSSGQF